MTTQEIPKDRWRLFLDDFSRAHEGWPVTVELLGLDVGDQIEVEEMPLEGITADQRDSKATIAIEVRSSDQDHITHFVSSPEHLFVLRDDEGVDTALEIESSDGPKTLLRFTGHEATPEQLQRKQ